MDNLGKRFMLVFFVLYTIVYSVTAFETTLQQSLQQQQQHQYHYHKSQESFGNMNEIAKNVYFQQKAGDLPAVHYNVTQLIESFGYPCHQHFATTKDGFILSMQRIPFSKISPPRKGKPVVFLQHGFLDSANTWVNNLPSQSLAFVLADAGFDVWLGNSRGNVYSDRNTHLSPEQSDFWDWSWDQMGALDLPAAFDEIEAVTGERRVAYVGHSQGTTQAFAAFSSFPSIAERVSVMIALAPVARTGHISVPLLPTLAKFHLDKLFEIFGNREFAPSTTLIEFLLPKFCAKFPSLCKNTYCVVAGCELSNVNTTRLPVYFSHLPAGTSSQDVIHWAQGVRDDAFQYFNYGSSKKNKDHYGQPDPPLYHLEHFPIPVAIYHGGKDTFADPTDVDWILKTIPQEKIVQRKYIADYGHGDFVWGVNAVDLIYNNAMEIIRKYH